MFDADQTMPAPHWLRWPAILLVASVVGTVAFLVLTPVRVPGGSRSLLATLAGRLHPAPPRQTPAPGADR